MLANIQKQIKLLESKSTPLKEKLDAHLIAKTELETIDKLLDNLNNNNNKSVQINYNNIDDILDNVTNQVEKLNPINITKDDLKNLMEIKSNILACKEFIDNSKNVNIFVSENNGNLNNITNKIKNNLLINTVYNQNSESGSDSSSDSYMFPD